MDINQNKIWTVIDIINWGTDFFRVKRIESPRLCIELLLCHVLHFERIDIYLQHDKPMTKSELELLHSLVKRKADREPIQYIISKAQFYGLEFEVNRNVLIPRPETEILVEEAIKIVSNYSNPRILDIGTGCGNIAVSIAANFRDSSVLAIDKSIEAINVAKNNSERLGVKNVEYKIIDILQNIPTEKFDIIISNPPYIKHKDYVQLMPDVLRYEPADALTDNKDGLTFYRRFAEIFPGMLNIGGMFLLEIGYDQSELIGELFYKAGFEFDFIDDFNKIKRICVGRKN